MSSLLKKVQKLYLYYGIVLSVYLSYLILNKEINIFFIVYLYWWDTFLQSFFARISLNNMPDSEARKESVTILNTHFFMCSIHLIFIIVLFGFVMINSDEVNSYFQTVKLLLFRDSTFNIAIIVLLMRELNLLFFKRKNQLEGKTPILSTGIFVLHVSIILGVFLWFGVQRNVWGIREFLGNFGSISYVIPFLILKILTELFASRKSLF